MIVLASTTDRVLVTLDAAKTTNDMYCTASWRDITTTGYSPGRTSTITNGTTAVELVPDPGASTQRVIDFINIYNYDTASKTVLIQYDDNGTLYNVWRGLLKTGEAVVYADKLGFMRLDSQGNPIRELPTAGTVNVDIQTFTATGAGTWTKPTVASHGWVPTAVWAVCVGGGGGGGGGGTAATTAVHSGGAGGGGGAYGQGVFTASDLGDTEAVTVGVGGTAGGGGASGASGTDGGAGGVSSFGTTTAIVSAFGGGGGSKGFNAGSAGGGGGGGGTAGVGAVGTTAGGAGGLPLYSEASLAEGGAGGAGGDSVYGGCAEYGGGGGGGHPDPPVTDQILSHAGWSIHGGGGGGVGGSCTTTYFVDALPGGRSGLYYDPDEAPEFQGENNAGKGGAAPTAGGAGSDGTSRHAGGGGGGGGATFTANTAGAVGGAGGIPGGGGGGGGSGCNTSASGAGGAGGRGEVRVYSW